MLAFCHPFRCFCFLCISLPLTLVAADRGFIHGTVTDPLGAVVANAKVELLESAEVAASVTTGQDGHFRIEELVPGLEYDLFIEANATPLRLAENVTAPGGGCRELGQVRVQPKTGK